jgi:hypothetical protein
MGFKALDHFREIVYKVAPKCFAFRHPGDTEFIRDARAKGALRDDYVAGYDGATIIDKYLRPSNDVKALTGSYVSLKIRKEIESTLQQPGCGGVVFVMDLPDRKTRAKQIDYERSRYKDVVADVADPEKGMIIHHGFFPAGDKWTCFKLNPKLRRQANCYLFQVLSEAAYEAWNAVEMEQKVSECKLQQQAAQQAAKAAQGRH